MANKGWSTPFDEPIVLDDGTKLITLRDAIHYFNWRATGTKRTVLGERSDAAGETTIGHQVPIG
jgi:hypothetical protein